MQHLDKNYLKKAIITHNSKNDPHSDDVSIADEAESTDQSDHVNDGVDESNHNSDEVTETDDLGDVHDSDGADESEDDDGCDNPDGPNKAKELD